MTPMPGVYDVKGAAKYLRICTKTLLSLCRTGMIRSAKIGARYRFREEWLVEYMESNSTYKPGSKTADEILGR